MRKDSLCLYRYLFWGLLGVFSVSLEGQIPSCPVVYEIVEEPPVYKDGDKALVYYLFDELTPVIAQCCREEDHYISKLYAQLVIDQAGQVVEVTFKRIDLGEASQEKIRQKLMSMQGWTAGKQDGKAVCCRVYIPINCLKWE